MPLRIQVELGPGKGPPASNKAPPAPNACIANPTIGQDLVDWIQVFDGPWMMPNRSTFTFALPVPSSRVTPRRTLSLFDSISIIVGTIIGSGIFKTAGLVASNASSFSWTIGFWLMGGLLSLIGALCFAELTTRYRDEVGGDYVYLRNAFGRPIGFMFAWATFWIVRPGNIGAMAMVFAEYFNQLFPTGRWLPEMEGSLIPYALLAIVSLSAINLLGMRTGKNGQNLLTIAKILGIGGVIFLGIVWGDNAASTAASTAAPKLGAIWMGMVFVMFSFGGWNDIAFVAGEIRSPERNLLRSLLLGILVVTTVYVLLNVAFYFALGFEGMTQSPAIAQDAVRAVMGTENWIGKRAGNLISVLVCVSCLGAVNGMIITGPRIYYAVGRDFPVFRFLGEWSVRRDIPWQATIFQLVITAGMTLLCLGYADAFSVIVNVVAPYFWGFLGLAALSLLVFRWRERGSTPPTVGFRAPLFPLEPIVLASVCGCLTWAATSYAISQRYIVPSIVVGLMMIVGVVLGIILSIYRPTESLDSDSKDPETKEPAAQSAT